MLLSTDFDGHPLARRLCRSGAITYNGRRVSFAEFRRACVAARAKGWQVFPHEGCRRIGPDGYCTDREACEAEQRTPEGT